MRYIDPNSNCQSLGAATIGRRDPEQRVRLNAATGGAGPLPIITTNLSAPLNVVTVSINTRNFEDPRILLHFTGIINLPLGISVTLNFQITRTSSNDGTIQVGPTFTFSTLVDVLEAESFAFQYFDSDLAPSDYTYTVQLSTNSILDITPGLTINNATLSALAVDEG